MESQNIKQWIRDYLDFAMPLIMVIVALNLVDLFIDLPYKYQPERYHENKIDDFFIYEAHLSVFMRQVNEGRLLLYSLIFVGIALLTRLFTNRLMVNIKRPLEAMWLFYCVVYGLMISDSYYFTTLAIIAFDGIIGLIIFWFLFKLFKIFFANCPIAIKNALYGLILFIMLLALLIDKLGTIEISLISNKVLFMALVCFVPISVIFLFIKELYALIKKTKIIIPYDIQEIKMDIKSEADAILEAQKERQKRNRIINDIADAVRKRL